MTHRSEEVAERFPQFEEAAQSILGKPLAACTLEDLELIAAAVKSGAAPRFHFVEDDPNPGSDHA
jgi:hypothetical protein